MNSKRETIGRLALGAVLGVFLVETWERTPQLDDAYISYRYARNLVEGLGLVWNAGERVEGYTNLLWTLLLAGGIGLGLDAPSLGHGLGVASGAAALIACYWLARSLLPPSRSWLAPAASLGLLASTPFLRWSLSGMETTFFTALITGAIAAGSAGRSLLMTAFLSLAVLTRPDAGLFAVILYAFPFISRLRSARAAPGRRALVAPLVWLFVLASLTAFRLAYYGDYVPNTFYAKVGGIPLSVGVFHLSSFLRDGAGLMLVPAGFAALRLPPARAAAACVVAVFGYVVWIGGDGFGQRFFVPIVPALTALALAGTVAGAERSPELGAGLALCCTAALWQSVLGPLPWLVIAGLCAVLGSLALVSRRLLLPRTALAVCVAALALLAALGSAVPELGHATIESVLRPERRTRLARSLQVDARFEVRGRAQARRLADETPPPRLVAAGAIGSVGFHSRVPILDLFGLTDAVVAKRHAAADAALISGHQRSDADYVLSRAPEYILIMRRPDGPPESWPHLLPAVEDLWAHPELERLYEWDRGIPAYRLRRARTAP